MAGLVRRKPLIGLVAGLLFGSLGYLLLGVAEAGGAARYLFVVSGYSFLFVAAASLLAAAHSLLLMLRSR